MSDIAEGGSAAGVEGPLGEATNPDASVAEASRSRRGRVLGLGALVVGVLGAAVWFVGPSLMPERCFLDGEEIPCESVATLAVDECWVDEALPIEECWVDEALSIEECDYSDVSTDHFEAILATSGVAASGFPESSLDDAQALYGRIAASVFAIGPTASSGELEGVIANGTAWAIHSRFVITNQHVIEEIESGESVVHASGGTEVALYQYPDKRPIIGRVIAVDANQDVAIIELNETTDVDPLVVSDRAAVAGEPVMYVGHPGLMEQMWIAGLGVVTGYEFPLDKSSVTSTVPSYPGASGSPIVNLNGEVVSLLTGGLFYRCGYEIPGCIADSTVQYASLPVGPTVTTGIDGPALRKFFTDATGEALLSGSAVGELPTERVLVGTSSVGSYALYREREQASERGRDTTVSGFPVSQRGTVAGLYDRLADAVFLVEAPDGAPIGTAWLAGPSTVVTNEHVSTPARSGDVVVLRRRDGSAVNARIVEESVPDDLSILRLDAALETPPLQVAPQNVGVDVPVFYIGHPGWMEQPWITGLGVTTGYDTQYPNRMLTTVPAEGGASGSPIFNLAGEVVAILSFTVSGDIPLDGYPVADSSTQYFALPVSPGSGGVDSSTLRSYIERHAGTP